MTPPPERPPLAGLTVVGVRPMGTSRLDRFVPDTLRHDDDSLRLGRLVVGAALTVGLSSVGLAAARFVLDEPPSHVGWVIAGIAVASLSMLVVLQRLPRPRIVGTMFTVGGMLGTCSMAAVDGGLFSEGLYYAVFVPLVTALFSGLRGSLALAGLGTAYVTALLLLHLDGHDFGKGNATSTALMLHHFGLVGSMWFGAYVGGLFEGNRVRALESQRATELAASRLKDEFISVVSHELRTPLTAIRGSLGLLAHGVAGKMSPQANELLDMSVRNAERLNSLIDDLLDLQRLKQHGMEFHIQSVALADQLAQAQKLNMGYAQRAAVELALGEPVPEAIVDVDTGRLQQVLANLISNAIKFSPPEGTVTIRALVNDTGVRIEVEDHGPGITEERREAIFEPFRQGDASDKRAQMGSGLGLTIARQMAERMGGRLDFRSTPGQGSVFFLDLPQRAAGDGAACPTR